MRISYNDSGQVVYNPAQRLGLSKIRGHGKAKPKKQRQDEMKSLIDQTGALTIQSEDSSSTDLLERDEEGNVVLNVHTSGRRSYSQDLKVVDDSVRTAHTRPKSALVKQDREVVSTKPRARSARSRPRSVKTHTTQSGGRSRSSVSRDVQESEAKHVAIELPRMNDILHGWSDDEDDDDDFESIPSVKHARRKRRGKRVYKVHYETPGNYHGYEHLPNDQDPLETKYRELEGILGRNFYSGSVDQRAADGFEAQKMLRQYMSSSSSFYRSASDRHKLTNQHSPRQMTRHEASPRKPRRRRKSGQTSSGHINEISTQTEDVFVAEDEYDPPVLYSDASKSDRSALALGRRRKGQASRSGKELSTQTEDVYTAEEFCSESDEEGEEEEDSDGLNNSMSSTNSNKKVTFAEEEEDLEVTPRTERSRRSSGASDTEIRSILKRNEEEFSESNTSPRVRVKSISPRSRKGQHDLKSSWLDIPSEDNSRSPSMSPRGAITPTDHLLKNTDNDKIKTWLEEKEKLEKKRRKEEKKKERKKRMEERKERERNEKRFEESKKKVQNWIRTKQREARLLKRQQTLQDTFPSKGFGKRGDEDEVKLEVNVIELGPRVVTGSSAPSQPETSQNIKQVLNTASSVQDIVAELQAEKEVENKVSSLNGKNIKKQKQRKKRTVPSSILQHKKAKKAEFEQSYFSKRKTYGNALATSRSISPMKSRPSPEEEARKKDEEERKRREESRRKRLSYDGWLKQKRREEIEQQKSLDKELREKQLNSDPMMENVISQQARRRLESINMGKKKIFSAIPGVADSVNYPYSGEQSENFDEETPDRFDENGSKIPRYTWIHTVGPKSPNTRPHSARSKSSGTHVSSKRSRPSSARVSSVQFGTPTPQRSSASPVPSRSRVDSINADGPNPFKNPIPPPRPPKKDGPSYRRQKYASYVRNKISGEERPEPQGCDRPEDLSHDGGQFPVDVDQSNEAVLDNYSQMNSNENDMAHKIPTSDISISSTSSISSLSSGAQAADDTFLTTA